MKYSITPTILNQFIWVRDCPPGFQAEAKKEFADRIDKKRLKTTEKMKRGNTFEENCLHASLGGKYISPQINQISNIIAGGIYQKKVFRDIKFNDLELKLNGKCDVIKDNYIYDIKRVDKFKTGKYDMSSQHLIYLLCTGLPYFKYLIGAGVDDDNLHKYEALYKLTSRTGIQLNSILTQFFEYLKENDLYMNYLKNWRLNNDE